MAFVFIATFPRSQKNPTPVTRFCYFNEREILILVERVLRDDPSKEQTTTHVSWKDAKSTVRRNVI